MNFERVLQKVLWRLVTEGSISYRRIKLSFGLGRAGGTGAGAIGPSLAEDASGRQAI